jgi:hypothetical protein
MSSLPKYKKTPLGWNFEYDGQDVLFHTKQIGILVQESVEGDLKVLRHGDWATLQAVHEKHIQAPDSEKAVLLFDTSKAEEEDLNRIIQNGRATPQGILRLISPLEVQGEEKRSFVLLTRDLSPAKQHVLQGGKVLLDNPLKGSFQTLDLALACKSQNIEVINPKDYTHELIVWPDGTEVDKDDYSPNEYSHMSDDFETVVDMDEDMRDLLQKALAPKMDEPGTTVQILAPTRQEGFVLPVLPKTTEWAEGFDIPSYRRLARKSILNRPASAQVTNLRLELMETELAIVTELKHRNTTKTLEAKREKLRGKIDKLLYPWPTSKNPEPAPEQQLAG